MNSPSIKLVSPKNQLPSPSASLPIVSIQPRKYPNYPSDKLFTEAESHTIGSIHTLPLPTASRSSVKTESSVDVQDQLYNSNSKKNFSDVKNLEGISSSKQLEPIRANHLGMLDRRGHDIDEDEDNDRNCEHDRFGILPSVLFDRSKIIKNRASDQNRSYKKVMIRFGGSYLLDWIFLILLGVILSMVDKLDGFQREFDLTDPSIKFPHALTERVPMSLLIVLSVIVPLVLIILINLLTVRSGWDLHTGLLGLGLSLCLTLVTTVIVKVTVGRPRPDFLARCQPLVSEIISNSSNVTNSLSLSNASICTANRETREFKDGFKSFPSGHSSAAWSGLGYLSLYMAGKFHVFDRNHLKIYSTIKLWVSIAPIFAATLIAISRTMDYRHHWEDVLIGSLIGLGFSYLSYRNYYYPLSSKQSHRPYSPRSSSSSSSTKAQLPIALRSSLLNKSNDDNEDKSRMVGDEEQGCRAESVSPEELIYHGNYRFENVRSSRILNNGSNESMTSISSGANVRTSNDSSLKEAQGSRGYRYINKTDK